MDALNGVARDGNSASLVVGEVAHTAAPERLKKGLARHPFPIMVLARLAVSVDWQKHGVVPAVLKDAVLRTLHAADIAGIRTFAVHAKDQEARGLYEHFAHRSDAPLSAAQGHQGSDRVIAGAKDSIRGTASHRILRAERRGASLI